MLTNTDATAKRPTQATATTIAIDETERRCRAALRDIARLTRTGKVSGIEAADLESETIARFIAKTRELETRSEEDSDPAARSADRTACIDGQRPAASSDRPRGHETRGLSARARALRERQMRAVASARVSSEVLRGLWLDEDDETLATRGELAAAGLL